MTRGIYLFSFVLFTSAVISAAFIVTPQSTFQHPSTLHAARTNEDGISVGFIGCGTIASAIATGLASQTRVDIGPIAVSKRSKEKSSALQEQFPEKVTIYEHSQEIIDEADLIFVCVLPQQVSKVLQSLSFDRERHTLVSLVSTANLDSLADDSSLDASKVWKMICLPSVSRHEGACLVCPAPEKDNPLFPLFESLGGCIPCATEEMLQAAMLSTCVMGPLYGVMRRSRDWLIDKGLNPDDADRLITQQYYGALSHASLSGLNLDELVGEQTPGGLNEQALRELDEMGVLKCYDQVMDSVHDRIRGGK